jgi:hypothetical protein
MIEIWVEWESGDTECVDTAENETEARYLVEEYRMAFSGAVRIWSQESKDE